MRRKPNYRRSSWGWLLVTVWLALLLLSGCVVDESGMVTLEPEEPASLVLASHDSFNISAEVLAEFELAHNAKVEYLALGDAGTALNKVILSKDAPLADVMFGVGQFLPEPGTGGGYLSRLPVAAASPDPPTSWSWIRPIRCCLWIMGLSI